ncbi:solute carrier family 4 member 1b (Diego blood group) [Triplophysa rosa]|uniref:solute carrier family 4 member 1b (Diego blood group) n=1 Tax=Triplophysa rosa TaxID=992332 RepID=UPI002545DC48|nr:solute carrier family 4 member 1b (Diego blood group) [Triplophysa rosa]
MHAVYKSLWDFVRICETRDCFSAGSAALILQVYVKMNENSTQQSYWQEMGRWMGYEETYDVEAGRWGPLHISYLTFNSLVQLRRTMNTGVVMLDIEEKILSSILEKIVDALVDKREILAGDRDKVLQALMHKQSQSMESQPLTSGVEMEKFSVTEKRDTADSAEASMVLVGALEFLERPTVAFVRLRDAVVLESALETRVPVRFIFILIGPTKNDMNYHECGRAMAALLADKVFNQVAFQAQSDSELTDAVTDFMDCCIVIPPTEIPNESMLTPLIPFQKKLLQERLRPSDPKLRLDVKPCKPSQCSVPPAEDPLARTGVPFGGMIRDFRRRYKHYTSDIKDALNVQVVAAIIFIYFAALSPAITFGGLLADKVENMMGVSELMISTSVQGIIFCLIAAQPVLVIGFSGPLLVFEEAFYTFCKSKGIEYIVGRVWVGAWLVVIVVAIVAVEGSFLVRFISRFTQEIFSILISLIFIYETFSKLGKVFKEHPLMLNYNHLNGTAEDPWHTVVSYQRLVDNFTGNVTVLRDVVHRAYPNTALLSMCLMFGCFSLAYYLRMFKNGTFLPGKIRRLLGDFGVPIAIFLMVAVDINIEDAYTQKLVVPKGLQVSNPKMRGWFINPLGEHKSFPVWMMFASVIPAMLVFILIFLESQITTLIVSKPERKMVKGSGFHMDLLILVSMGGLGAIFGVPWLSAATVRSVSHANALTVMSKAPKPEIEKVLEQRVSGVVVALLVGLSILMEPILKMIPVTALFGIFLYMGITSLSGIQLWDRMLLLLIPKKYHPNEPYVTRVSTSKMHVYTAIQIGCLVILWVVKSSPVSLALPFVLILTIPLRMFMTGRLFTETEMKCLDADGAKVTFEEEPGVDVYNESQMPL